MDSKLFCHEGVKSQKEEIEANFSGSVRLTEWGRRGVSPRSAISVFDRQK